MLKYWYIVNVIIRNKYKKAIKEARFSWQSINHRFYNHLHIMGIFKQCAGCSWCGLRLLFPRLAQESKNRLLPILHGLSSEIKLRKLNTWKIRSENISGECGLIRLLRVLILCILNNKTNVSLFHELFLAYNRVIGNCIIDSWSY